MAVQKMFRALVCLSLLLNGCCIGWFMLSGRQPSLGGAVRSGRGTATGLYHVCMGSFVILEWIGSLAKHRGFL